jgi:hypothetical protein
MLALFLCLLCAVVVGEEITGANHGLLREGCWLVRFYAPWCGACANSNATWFECKELKELRFGCRFAEVNVDENVVLAEAFGVRHIPSYFVLAKQGLCRWSGETAFTTAAFAEFHHGCAPDSASFESGWLRDPRSPV